MPETLSELFNGGVVTARHPALLKSGELQRADDCVYREKDPAIFRAPGRKKLNATALGSVWASASAIKGMAHLSFEKSRYDQLLAYCGTVLARCALTTSASPTIDGIDLALSATTISGNTQITLASTSALQVNWSVLGSNIQAGSRILTIDDSTHVTLNRAPTSSTTLTLTFNPMLELGGPASIAGTVATNVFTATAISIPSSTIAADGVTVTTSSDLGSVTPGMVASGSGIPAGTLIASITSTTVYVLNTVSTPGVITVTATPYPFLADALGARIYKPGTRNVTVKAVSVQNGTTGHYNAVTLTSGVSDGATTLVFSHGCVQRLDNSGTTSENMLDLTQYGGTYFVWTGKDEIRRVEYRSRVLDDGSGTDLDEILTTRPVGLRPVVDQPKVVSTANGAYAWPPTLTPGYYWFLVTEIFDPDGDGDHDSTYAVESAYYGTNKTTKNSGVPVPVTVPAATGYGVTLTFPTQVNIGVDGRISNFWGVYMYGPTTDDRAVPSLAAFKRIMKIPIVDQATAQTQVIQENRFTQYAQPSAVESISGSSQFNNAIRMTFGYGGNGDASSGKSHNSPVHTPAAQYLKTFDKDGATGVGFIVTTPWDTRSIFGIRLTINGMADPSGNDTGRVAGYFVQLVSGSKASDRIMGEYGGKHPHSNFHGGEMDTWGVAWTTSDLANLKVLVEKSGSASGQHLRVEWIKVEVFFTGNALNLNGKPFRIVTYRDQIGDVVNEPAYGPAPVCNTGDLYQGSLVVNDLSDEVAIRFSLPGEPEAFPKPYVMRFNTTKRKDRVTFIRSLGQVLIVGLENGIQRVNYLPTETDTDFHEGLAHQDLAADHGIPGPLAGVKFDWPGRGTVIAYASISGVFYTDGLTTTPLNMDLDWANTVKLSALSTCVFRVYPKEKWLVLYYCPAGASHNKNTRALVFHYANDKVKNGDQLPALGPIKVSGCSSVEVVSSGYTYLFTGHESNGFIYQEDYGTSQASGYQVHDTSGALADAPITPIIRMRRWYPAGITHDCHLYKAYLLLSLYGTTYTAVATSIKGNTTLSAATAVFAAWLAGMRVKGTGIDEGTIVLSVAGDFKSVVLSRAANAAGTSITFTADDGTIGVTDRGCSIGEVAAGLETVWGSSLASDMIVVQLDSTRQGLELQIEKVPIHFASNADGYRSDSDQWADLAVNMRLHQCMLLFDDQGPEQTRSTA